ncbi:hypothetical protein HAX54_001360 [Datura stramonium]|uniref:Uncharacterized protein n=1 Tax=Datura stramonium TaxID=4076 RepID=A0ABS8T315_DATST|nr:hypothetical protein [Datura stramonium]
MGKGRAPCCDKSKVKKGPWSCEEDLRLIAFIQKHGHQNWRSLPKQAGLLRCGKSCRLRWINYLRPDVKRGNFTPQEEDTIVKLHQTLGNKWSKIASHLPGRTDNEIKNVWNTHLKKRVMKKLEGATSRSSSSSSTSVLLSHTDHTSKNVTEKEEATKSCSPTSSYNASSVSNLSQVHEISSGNVNIVDMDWIFQLMNEEPFPSGVIETPLECDVDFWDMLDIIGSSPPHPHPPPNSDYSKLDNHSDASCQGLSNELGV